MKKLLPILFLVIAITTFYTACKKDANEQPQPQQTGLEQSPNNGTLITSDTTFTSANRHIIYIDQFDNVKRVYSYDLDNNLIQFFRWVTINDSTLSYCKFSPDSILINQTKYFLNSDGLAKYKLRINSSGGIIDSVTYTYNNQNQVVQVVLYDAVIPAGSVYEYTWYNGNPDIYPGALTYFTAINSRVDLFGASNITVDNNLTGQNASKLVGQLLYGPISPGGGGPRYSTTHGYTLNTDGYVIKRLTIYKDNYASNLIPVTANLNYYTYIIEP